LRQHPSRPLVRKLREVGRRTCLVVWSVDGSCESLIQRTLGELLCREVLEQPALLAGHAHDLPIMNLVFTPLDDPHTFALSFAESNGTPLESTTGQVSSEPADSVIPSVRKYSARPIWALRACIGAHIRAGRCEGSV